MLLAGIFVIKAENFSIEVFGERNQPFSALFADALKYEVQFEVHERFTKNDLDKSEQRINAMWVQIHTRETSRHKVNGELNIKQIKWTRQSRTPAQRTPSSN